MIAKLILLKYNDKHKYFGIRLTQNGKRKFKSVDVPFTEKEWQYKTKPRKNQLKIVAPPKKDATPLQRKKYDQYIRNRKFVSDLEAKYNDQINKLISKNRPFSFQKVFGMVDNPHDLAETVLSFFQQFIDEKYIANKQYGAAANYKGTLSKMKGYYKQDFLFNEMDVTMLIDLNKKMTIDGLAGATKNIHLRNLRALYRYAVKKGIANMAEYPFMDEEVWKDTTAKDRAIALSRDDVNKIRHLRKQLEEGSEMWHACNYFMFGYLGRGINFQDIARLKWEENRIQGRIVYIRHKTRAKVQKQLDFPITDEIQEILTWYRTHNIQLNNPYIFPILNASHITEKTIHNRIKKIRKQVNVNLKKVGEEIGAEFPLTTYVWRHTFSQVAQNDLETPIQHISKLLGHHDLKTTESYLGKFPSTKLDESVIGL